MARIKGSRSVGGQGLEAEGVTVEVTFLTRKIERDGGAWSVSQVEEEGGRRVSAVGPMLDPRPGARVRLMGVEETRHPVYGRQLAYRSYEWAGWSDLRGMEKYLCEVCDGIGKKSAGAIIDVFGQEAVEKLRTDPREVARQTGLALDVAEEAARKLSEVARFERLQVLLRGAGFGNARIGALTRRYGDKALEILQQDPWRVSLEVDGFGFVTADRIALALGHPPDSPSRGRAAVAHFTREASYMDGHTYVASAEVAKLALEAGLTAEAIKHGMEWAQENDWARDTEEGGFVLAVPDLREAEEDASRIVFMQGVPQVAWNEKEAAKVLLDDFQKAALATLRKSRIAVVTGGPGTGKTHLINALWRGLGGASHIAILTPTGKAAARIREIKPLEAMTIHRALGWGRNTDEMMVDGEVQKLGLPVDAPVVVVDEASMVDSSLFAALVRSMRPNASLWLFGDADQLPPVGPGSPFADIIESGKVPVARLQKIHRTDKQWIAENARRVNVGERPHWGKNENGEAIEDFFFVPANTPEEAENLVVDLVSRRLPGHFKIDSEKIQVLTPMNKRACGVDALNVAIRSAVNSRGEEGPGKFRLGDRVIHTKNNYSIGVMNGEVGKVVAVEPHPKNPTMEVDFGDRTVPYNIETARQLKLAYAISVHKAQGSQFSVIVLPVLRSHSWMLSRRLLYTGISRARVACVLVGEEDAVGLSVRNVRSANRNTFMKKLLSQGACDATGTEGVVEDEREGTRDGDLHACNPDQEGSSSRP